MNEGESVYGDRANQLVVCTNLTFLTFANSTYNAQELIRGDGVQTLAALLPRVMIGFDTPADDIRVKIALNILKTFSGLAFYESARKIMCSLPSFVDDICRFASLHLHSEIVQYALNTMARMCLDSKLQSMIVEGTFGGLWAIIPLLFSYDSSMEESGVAASESTNSQAAANLNAKLAINLLGRLGGYLSGDHKTPINAENRKCIRALFTAPIESKLSTMSGPDLLKLLNSYTETSFVIWNPDMKNELLAFVHERSVEEEHTKNANATASHSFIYKALANELVICNIYVRVFNSQR